MSVAVHAIPLGVTRCYLLVGRDGRAILVDGGAPDGERAFRAGLARHGIVPEQIGLLLLTHGHWDHFGTAAAIREITGAKVAIHHAEAQRVEGALKMMPAAVTLWGRLFGTVIAGVMRAAKLPPCPVDLQVGDDGLDLSPFGIAGRAIHTPGHSPGSLTVLVDGGDAYVGDMAMNGPPLTLRPGLPIFAEEPAKLAESWLRVLEAKPHTVHPAHGKPFPAQVMRSRLELTST